MKCLVVGQHLKVLSKSIRLMTKYADYVTILPRQNELILQTVNDSSSAFVECCFGREFFTHYDFDDNESSDCKVEVKSLLLVFRIVNLDKYVESCKIVIDLNKSRITFEMKLKYDVYREYFIPYMEHEAIRCQRVSDNKENRITIKSSAKILSDMFKHFAQSTKEITIWLYANHIRLKTFIEIDDQNFFHVPSTSFSYMSSEFNCYNFTEEYSMTFNLGDMKAFLDFASFQNQMVSVYLQSESRPIELMISNRSDHYTARVILATFEFPDANKPEPPPFNGRVSTFTTVSTLGGVGQGNNNSINESLNYSTTTQTSSTTNVENVETNMEASVEEDDDDHHHHHHHPISPPIETVDIPQSSPSHTSGETRMSELNDDDKVEIISEVEDSNDSKDTKNEDNNNDVHEKKKDTEEEEEEEDKTKKDNDEDEDDDDEINVNIETIIQRLRSAQPSPPLPPPSQLSEYQRKIFFGIDDDEDDESGGGGGGQKSPIIVYVSDSDPE